MFRVMPTGPETTRERWDFYFTSREPTEHMGQGELLETGMEVHKRSVDPRR